MKLNLFTCVFCFKKPHKYVPNYLLQYKRRTYDFIHRLLQNVN